MNTSKNPLLATFGAGWEEMLGPTYGKRVRRKGRAHPFRKSGLSRWDIKQGPLRQAASRRVFPH